MAIVTLTYTANMAEPAGEVHAGVNAISFAFNSGGTAFGTACDVALLGRVPNGCTILGGYVSGQGGGAGGANFLLTAVNSGDTNGSFTLSATAASHFTVRYPVRISLSADATVSDAVLYLNCVTGASAAASLSVHGVLYYTCDGRETSL